MLIRGKQSFLRKFLLSKKILTRSMELKFSSFFLSFFLNFNIKEK